MKIMEYLDKNDLQIITTCAGQAVNNNDFIKLKNVYSKLKHICTLLDNKGYKHQIRQDPRKQAGPGKFAFQHYHWAKVYPKEMFDISQGKFAYIIGFSDTVHFHLMGINDFEHLKPSQKASKECWKEVDFENKNYNYIVDQFIDFDKKNRNLYVKTGYDLKIDGFEKIIKQMLKQDLIKLLNYKKQIILQGPPGTGKTREAKLIAIEMLGLSSTDELKNNEQFKLIQFHPSYTYEDFVRGIVAKPNPNGSGILYEAENKALAKIAEVALNNYRNSKKKPDLVSKEIWVEQQFQKFKIDIESQLEGGNSVLIKEGTVAKIIAIEELATRVNRYDNENDKVLLKDSDIIHGYIGLYLAESVTKIKENDNLSKSARSGMYYLYQNLIEKFKTFLDKNELSYTPHSNIQNQELKNYVLIIDEINRANLSSVLGELIYALEYRGEEVENMYDIDKDNKIILPPNLYIIGTMNTADRSVGHIDYAIRRRFAFVDVLPKNLKNELNDNFKDDLFMKVAKLFIKNYDPKVDYNNDKNKIESSEYLSNEFEPKDVWLGHSYFIQQYGKDNNGIDDKSKPIDFDMRIQYEIKPILEEYIKDGILKESARAIIKELKTD